MADKIQVLERAVAEKIAAGEVVERPASVVKELVENSIDANATRIDVEVRDGGRNRIKVSDNGSGMTPGDASLAFERHSTSKIREFDDLYRIVSMGFRGEALASIAAVSRVQLTTREKGKDLGTKVIIEGGDLLEIEEAGCPEGTTILVNDIFFNVPARRKFLSSFSSEQGTINKLLVRSALANPEVFFTFTNEKKKLFSYPPVENQLLRAEQIYGSTISGRLLEIEKESNEITINGIISHPSLNYSNRTRIFVFVNRRYIRSPLIYKAIQDAFGNIVPPRRFPLAILFLNISPHLIDVNIHPTKEEIKFSQQSIIFPFIKSTIQNRLKEEDTLSIAFHKKPEKEYKKENSEILSLKQSEFSPSIFKSDFKLLKEEKKAYLSYDEADILLQKEKKGQSHLDISSISVLDKPVETGEKDSISEVDHDIENISELPVKKDKRVCPAINILGSFKNTYIIASVDNELMFIDQHVAHERINYDLLRRNLDFKTTIPSQSLLLPVTLDFTVYEAEWLKQKLSVFRELGFDIEDFGGNTFLLRGMPLALDRLKKGEFFQEIVKECVISEKRITSIDIMNDIMASIACKASIKAGDHLSDLEMGKLLKKLFNTDEPYYCPHGRPVIITFSENDLAKLFKRV